MIPGSSGAVLAAALVRSSPQRPLAVVARRHPRMPSGGSATCSSSPTRRWRSIPSARRSARTSRAYVAGERVVRMEFLLGGRLRIIVAHGARAMAERTLVPRRLEKRRLRLDEGRPPSSPAGARCRTLEGFRRVAGSEFSARSDRVRIRHGLGHAGSGWGWTRCPRSAHYCGAEIDGAADPRQWTGRGEGQGRAA